MNLSAGTRYENFSINDSTAAKPVFRAGLNFQAAEATWLPGQRWPRFSVPHHRREIHSHGHRAAASVPQQQTCAPKLPSTSKPGSSKASRWAGSKGFVDVAAFYQEYEDFIEFTFGTVGEPITEGLQGWIQKPEHGLQPRHRMGDVVDGTCHMGRNHPGLVDGYTYTNPISLTPDSVYGFGTNPLTGTTSIDP